MVLYLAVTSDKYELPLGVYDSLSEMAEAFGLAYNSVKSALHRKCDGSRNGYKFIRVEVL